MEVNFAYMGNTYWNIMYSRWPEKFSLLMFSCRAFEESQERASSADLTRLRQEVDGLTRQLKWVLCLFLVWSICCDFHLLTCIQEEFFCEFWSRHGAYCLRLCFCLTGGALEWSVFSFRERPTTIIVGSCVSVIPVDTWRSAVHC